LKSCSTYVTCSYIPPGSDSTIYEQHLSSIKTVISHLSERDLLIVLGDFNLHDISWYPSTEKTFIVLELQPSETVGIYLDRDFMIATQVTEHIHIDLASLVAGCVYMVPCDFCQFVINICDTGALPCVLVRHNQPCLRFKSSVYV